jgi:acetamidase/formamidase
VFVCVSPFILFPVNCLGSLLEVDIWGDYPLDLGFLSMQEQRFGLLPGTLSKIREMNIQSQQRSKIQTPGIVYGGVNIPTAPTPGVVGLTGQHLHGSYSTGPLNFSPYQGGEFVGLGFRPS